jgi:Uma2 family endonuclease
VTTTTEARVKTLLTAEQFLEQVGDGPYELVRGEVVDVPPFTLHLPATVCANVSAVLGQYGKQTGFGYALSNDFPVLTGRDPDTVRGADVGFYSQARLPFDASNPSLPAVPPDPVVEVYSPSNRRSEILGKVHEYLNVGVQMVWVVHPERRTVTIYRPGDPTPVLLSDRDVLEGLPELPGFRCPVAELFA